MVARVAARLRKPGAQVTVAAGRARFLAPRLRWLPVSMAPRHRSRVAGVHLGAFAALPAGDYAVAGWRALPLQRAAQGVSEEPVGAKRARAEVFRESIEFAEDQWDTPVLLGALRGLAERLMAQVRAAGVEARQAALTLRYTDREENRRTLALTEPAALATDLDPLLPQLLAGAWTRRVRLRALTLEAGRIYRPSAQMDLFAAESPRRPAQMALAAAIDRLRRLHGTAIVRRGWELGGGATLDGGRLG